VFIGGLTALPYLYINLSIKSRGVLTPKSARVMLYAPVTGPVIYKAISENQLLSKGDTICVIDTELLDTQIEFNKQLNKENEQYLNDLQKIAETNFTRSFNIHTLTTAVYRSAASELIQRMEQINNQIAKTRVDYKRDKKLFDSQVLSSKEFEKTAFAYQQAKSNYRLAKKEKMAQWKMDELSYRTKIDQTSSQIDQLEKERKRYFLTAPISGVVQQYSGVRAGSFVYANQKLGEISPDSLLIAEMYISPGDIGFVAVGKKVKIQVDAFNYNQWGMLDAEIMEVSDDISIINQAPVFRVRCTFNQPYLTLKNGYKGHLKKGMTLGGRIMIAKRSLYQLLYDKVDDWLNPAKA